MSLRAAEEEVAGEVCGAPSASGEGLSSDERLRDIALYPITVSMPSRQQFWLLEKQTKYCECERWENVKLESRVGTATFSAPHKEREQDRRSHGPRCARSGVLRVRLPSVVHLAAVADSFCCDLLTLCARGGLAIAGAAVGGFESGRSSGAEARLRLFFGGASS